jgi:hypothetical protein
MAKGKNKKKDDEEVEIKSPIIMAGSINDGLCNYTYSIKKGIGKGFTHNVKGVGIIDVEMEIAFHMLSAHLAVIDDVFFHSGEDIASMKEVRKHPNAKRYNVTGFKIKGAEEEEFVILTGTKQIECSNHFMNIETPKIPLDNLSSYKFHDELKAAVEKAREEVELYSNGKYTEQEPEIKEDKDQLNIGSPEAQVNEEEFEQGRV